MFSTSVFPAERKIYCALRAGICKLEIFRRRVDHAGTRARDEDIEHMRKEHLRDLAHLRSAFL